MIIDLIKIAPFCFLLLGGLQQCKAQIELPDKLNGMLLYVEDLDGIGGSASGKFSDLVAFDPVNKFQYILTSDNYYDQHPTYSSKTNKVYFESKREKFHPSVGLTAQSHIYELDLSTTKISLFDNENLRKSLSLKKWEELDEPLINRKGTQILFEYNWGDFKNQYNRFVLYNLTTNTFSFLFDSSYFSFRCVFSENDSNIVYHSQTDTKLTERTNYLGMINIRTKRNTKLLQVENEEYGLGDYKFNKLVFTGKVWNQDSKEAKLFIFDIIKKRKHIIASVKELGFREIKCPVFKDENSIFFIGSKESTNPDTFDEDIYLLNLNTREMKQITFTHNIKDNLRYYK